MKELKLKVALVAFSKEPSGSYQSIRGLIGKSVHDDPPLMIKCRTCSGSESQEGVGTGGCAQL